jgi:hypothetical protein
MFTLNSSTPIYHTVDPVYSERGYSEYTLIVYHTVSLHRSLVYSQIKYVYSEYPALVNTFCYTDPFTINGIDCNLKAWVLLF